MTWLGFDWKASSCDSLLVCCINTVYILYGENTCATIVPLKSMHGYQSLISQTFSAPKSKQSASFIQKNKIPTTTVYTVPPEKVMNFYHVLRVSEKLLARHRTEVVQLQSTWLLHHIIIRVVGPENMYTKTINQAWFYNCCTLIIRIK